MKDTCPNKTNGCKEVNHSTQLQNTYKKNSSVTEVRSIIDECSCFQEWLDESAGRLPDTLSSAFCLSLCDFFPTVFFCSNETVNT